MSAIRVVSRLRIYSDGLLIRDDGWSEYRGVSSPKEAAEKLRARGRKLRRTDRGYTMAERREVAGEVFEHIKDIEERS